MKSISILGCGWLGLALGTYLAAQGYTVKGSTTRQEKLEEINAKGIEAFVLQVKEEGLVGPSIDSFFQSEVLLLNIPPRRKLPEVAQRYPKEIQHILQAALRGNTKKILFVSSTAVYPSENKVVTESDTLAPETASGRGLVAAEQLLMEQDQIAVTILRLAGLVGGKRHPGKWFAGKKNLPGGKVPVNLVHREDCIAAIEAILVQEKWGTIYQFCADEHPLKEDYYPAMALQLSLEKPEFTGTPINPYKVVSNEKIKKELSLSLNYPDPYQMKFD